MNVRPVALAVLVLLASLAPMATAGGGTAHSQTISESNIEAYSGTHVDFEANESALVDYRVGGDTVLSTMEVQSESKVESALGLGVTANLDTITSIAGASLSMQSSAQASAKITVASGATVRAHDHSHGTLVVDAEKSQYVSMGLSAGSSAEAKSDERVLITTDDGSKAAVMVVGEGSVTVNDNGNVTANIKSDSKLVVRAYSEGRTDADSKTEQLIVNGTAAAEVFVDQQGGERVNGTITYDGDTEVTVREQTENTVNMTIDRAEHQGKVIIASASNLAAETADDITVRVDGEVAAQASSYSELRAAANDGATSKYMVKNSASAQADAEVLVAVNHFSKRTVSMSSADSSTDSTDDSTNGDASAEGSVYTGAHVDFETNASALVDYQVGGDTVVSTMEVRSESQVESALGLGVTANLDTITSIAGASLSMQSSAQASTKITVASGATVRAHDHSHGTLVVDADQSQYVELGLNTSSQAEAKSDERVIITTDDGTKAAVMVVGDGNVTVNSEGNVTANVKADSKLVVRAYSEERTESDEETEQLIVNGTAAAEVFVDQQDGERVNGTITYDSDTEVTVTTKSEESVNMTIDRAEHQGKVVIVSTSQFAAQTADDVTVRVDGEVAAQASSYSELRAATNDGTTSKYMVENSASAQADAEVLVAVNHFSERTVSMSRADSSEEGDNTDDGESTDGDTTDDEPSETTTTDSQTTADDSQTTADDSQTTADEAPAAESTGSGNGPGFGVIAALLSLFGLGSVGARRGQ